MRDRNPLVLEQFYIQFKKTCLRKLEDSQFSRTPVSDSPNLLNSEIYGLIYPKSFRYLRSLISVHWYFPQFLFWRVHLDLLEMNFHWLNRKQRILLKILLDSEIVCVNYFFRTETLTGSEIFGNLLGNDLRDCLKHLKIYRVKLKPIIPRVYRRGYRDKGARRPDYLWLPKSDYTFTEKQNDLEKEEDFSHKLISRIQNFLREDSRKEGDPRET